MITQFKTLFLLLSLSIFQPLTFFGQGIINNGAIMVITDKAYVYIDGNANGDYLNQTTGVYNGSIALDGELIVEGDWTNNASAGTVLINTSPSDGIVLLAGNTSTNMGGSRTTNFEMLTINKVGAGLSTTLGIDETVLGTLTLTNGVFTTNANYMIVTGTAAGSVTGYSGNSFINGNLRRYLAGAITPYAFPVGDGTSTTNYHLAELANHTLVGVTYINGSFAAVTEGGMTLIELGMQYVQANGRWIIAPDAVPSSGAFDMLLYKINLTGTFPDNQFAVVQRDLADNLVTDWQCDPCGIGNPGLSPNGGLGRMAADAYALRYGMTFTTADRVQFAIGGPMDPTPIELLSFTANCEDDGLQLEWNTSSETNNDYFTIEHSNDATNFETVAIIDGAGNSNTAIHYTVTDVNAESGNNYYCLKQTDFDGQYSYSDIITANCETATAFSIVNVIDNGNHLDIYITGSEGEEYVLNVFDATGRLISNKNDKLYSGINEVEVKRNDVALGIYIISLSGNAKHITQKILLGTKA